MPEIGHECQTDDGRPGYWNGFRCVAYSDPSKPGSKPLKVADGFEVGVEVAEAD